MTDQTAADDDPIVVYLTMNQFASGQVILDRAWTADREPRHLTLGALRDLRTERDIWKQRALDLQAAADQLRRQLDAAEAAPCGHDGTSFDALERLHARIRRDFNFDASESAAPDDERWARVMDDLVTFADEVYMPLADATKAPSETPPAAAPPSRFDFTTLLEPEPPAPAPHRVTVTIVHHINMTDDNDHYDEPSYEVHHTPQCDALPYGEDCWIDHQHRDVGTDDWPTEPGEYIASGEAIKSFNGEYTEYDFYMDFELVPNTLESAVAEAQADIATTPAEPEPAPIRHAWLVEAGDD